MIGQPVLPILFAAIIDLPARLWIAESVPGHVEISQSERRGFESSYLCQFCGMRLKPLTGMAAETPGRLLIQKMRATIPYPFPLFRVTIHPRTRFRDGFARKLT